MPFSLPLLKASKARVSTIWFSPSSIGSTLLAVGAVAISAAATIALWSVLPRSLSLLFIPAVMAGAYFGGLGTGFIAAILSELASFWFVPDAALTPAGTAIRLAVYFTVAIAIGSLAEQQHNHLKTLEEHVSRRTAELEHVNRTLSAEIAQRSELEQRLEYLVDHDPLTGLYNRHRFEEALAEEVSRASRYQSGGAVLLIDLDHFKDVNDTLGHQAGDQLLKTVGGVLKGCVRHTDIVARLGGDEFGVLLRHVNSERAALVADAIVKATRQRQVALGKQLTSVTTSVGIAMLDGSTAAQVLAGADFAMYEAKRSGRDAFVKHAAGDAGDNGGQRCQSEFERIRHAIDQQRFALYGQPIVDLHQNHRTTQYELLLRMLDNNDRPLPPSSFLPVAERLGLISLIDSWVVEKAIRLIADQAMRGTHLTCNVNISGKSVGDPAVVEMIDRTLKDTKVNPSQLVFEVTETAAIANLEDAKSFAEKLRVRGCKFALDDFGTGFGSFYYLKHIPFDYLKIDGDFIRGFSDNTTDTLVVEAIVGIAKGMGKKTIAEFVQSPAVAQRLKETGVNYAQGYQLGAPKPVTTLFAQA